MDNKKEKIEDFKTAISSTVRSLSNSQKIEVSFGSENSKSEKYHLFDDYFVKFYHFCFELQPKNMIKDAIKFKVL